MGVVEHAASIALGLSALVAAVWALAKWLRRPRFLCGIPPLIEEREAKGIPRDRLGRASVATAFRHRPDCFAEPFRRPHRQRLEADDERRLLADELRCREIRPDAGGYARLPVLIANRGKRMAVYTATITFYCEGGKVHVAEVTTETLPVYIYSDRPERVRGASRVADERIVAAYDAYLMDDAMTHWGDVIALTNGQLEATLFEMIAVDVDIEPDVESFFVLYTLDCTDGWTGARSFIQACRVVRDPRVMEATGIEPVTFGSLETDRAQALEKGSPRESAGSWGVAPSRRPRGENRRRRFVVYPHTCSVERG